MTGGSGPIVPTEKLDAAASADFNGRLTKELPWGQRAKSLVVHGIGHPGFRIGCENEGRYGRQEKALTTLEMRRVGALENADTKVCLSILLTARDSELSGSAKPSTFQLENVGT